MGKWNIILTVSIFVIVNVLFNYSLWQKLWLSASSPDIYSSDATITELLTETSYQNILRGENPFAPSQSLFYPYGMDFALNDPGTLYVLPFLILRPLLSISQSMLLSVLGFMLLASLCMYALLRYLKFRRLIAMTFSLVFAYMPFIAHRLLGHYTYTVHFFFPLIYLLIHFFCHTPIMWKKMIGACLIALSLALLLFSNFYYFIMVALALAFYSGWYLLTQPRAFWQMLRRTIGYFVFVLVIFVLAISPWLQAVRSIVLFEGITATSGYGSATVYSADILAWFIPNQYNYLYRGAVGWLSSLWPSLAPFEEYFLHNWEGFVYPGLILLGLYGWILLKLKRHTMPQSLWKVIRAPFLASFVFFVLALGPFLKIATVWHVNLEGVEVLFPLPFLLLRSLPGLSGLRVPSRLSAALVFFACLVGAYVITYLVRRSPRPKYYAVMGILLCIFLLDQQYFVPIETGTALPIGIYSYLKERPTDEVVMEIPLTVRDGFQYKGFVHALSPMQGAMLHGHPIMGGYFARVGQPIFDYYDRLRFVGYFLDITDRGNYNPLYEQPQDPQVYPFTVPLTLAQAELDFLHIGYVILKQDEPYSAYARTILSQLGFTSVMGDPQHTLYQRTIGEPDQDSVLFGSDSDYLHIGQGLSAGEPGTQVMIATRAQIFLSLDSPTDYQSLSMTARSAGTTVLQVFVNRQRVGEITIGSGQQEYQVPVAQALTPRVNSIMLIREATSDPVYFSRVGLE